MNITFERACAKHIDSIFVWLSEPHVMEFWDNSQEHKDDILNFIHHRKQNYFYGTFQYWIGSLNDEPFCFIVSDVIKPYQEGISDLHKNYVSQKGTTVTLDFCVGNTKYLGKGLAAPALAQFVDFYHAFDPQTDTFFIDPTSNNSRALHVYKKAGFQEVGAFDVQHGAFQGAVNILLVKKIEISINLK